jgi:hypothetical protein
MGGSTSRTPSSWRLGGGVCPVCRRFPGAPGLSLRPGNTIRGEETFTDAACRNRTATSAAARDQLVRAKTVAMLQPVRILGTAVAVEGMTSIRQ